jgi:shikimate kinase
LLRTDNPYGTLKALYDQRTPIYELAQVHVQSSPNTAIDDMANRVISALMTRNDVLESQEP